MGKIIMIGFIVVAIWVGLTIYTEGTDRAFGGLFSGLSSEKLGDARAPLEVIGHSATSARDAQLERIERQLGDTSIGLEGESE